MSELKRRHTPADRGAEQLELLVVTAPALWAAAQLYATALDTAPAPAPSAPPEAASEAPAAAPADQHQDPLEPLNRASYRANGVIDRVAFRPIAMTYRRIVPRPVRRGVNNALATWNEPIVAINDVLQGDVGSSERTTARFVVNITIGVLGVFDAADRFGLKRHDNGFAITLGKYGVGPGFYLFIPGLGPSSARDIAGYGVDIVSNPLTLIRHVRTGLISRVAPVVAAVDERANRDADLREVEVTATDAYATIRSIYQQQMQTRIRGEADPLDALAPLPEPAPPSEAHPAVRP